MLKVTLNFKSINQISADVCQCLTTVCRRELVCEKLMKLATDDENPELQQERESLEQELEFLRSDNR